jgi:hypothetical protein
VNGNFGLITCGIVPMVANEGLKSEARRAMASEASIYNAWIVVYNLLF